MKSYNLCAMKCLSMMLYKALLAMTLLETLLCYNAKRTLTCYDAKRTLSFYHSAFLWRSMEWVPVPHILSKADTCLLCFARRKLTPRSVKRAFISTMLTRWMYIPRSRSHISYPFPFEEADPVSLTYALLCRPIFLFFWSLPYDSFRSGITIFSLI